MRWGAAYVSTDLGHDDLGHAPAYAGNGVQSRHGPGAGARRTVADGHLPRGLGIGLEAGAHLSLHPANQPIQAIDVAELLLEQKTLVGSNAAPQ